MSYKVSSVNNNKRDTRDKRQAPQPFCKVCFDAKRPDYNTHFLKDFTGPQPVVLCPYLLALTCNYCKEQGHTVSYCEILKAKKASETGRDARESKNIKASQNGHFFIMRVYKDGEQTISHPSNSRKGVATGLSSCAALPRPVSTTNQFALLEDDDEDNVWEQPKRKGKKVVSFATQEAAVAVAAEPEPLQEVEQTPVLPTWAKIVAMPPPKNQTAAVSANESLKKNVKSLFVSSSSTAPEPAAFEKPMPVFIHPSTETKTNDESIEKYFFTPPTKMSNWADDSSEEDGW
jgi:hypothetical protein